MDGKGPANRRTQHRPSPSMSSSWESVSQAALFLRRLVGRSLESKSLAAFFANVKEKIKRFIAMLHLQWLTSPIYALSIDISET